MANNKLSLQRVLRASPEVVYRAFTEPDAMAFWLPPYGYTCTVDHMDVRIGGTYKMCFINFLTGRQHPFGGKFLELGPNEFIKHVDIFVDPDPAEVTNFIWIKKVSVGTELTIVLEGLPASLPPEMCCLGWQQSLEKLATLVEPKIPL